MDPRLKKWLIKPAIILAAVIAILAGILFVVLSTQQQRIVNIALAEVNQTFQGELLVRDSRISLFRHFPHIAIALADVEFYADKSRRGTPIFSVAEVHVGFDPWEILQRNYHVRKLSVEDGYLHLVQEQNGTINLLEAERAVVNTTEKNVGSDTSSAFSVDLSDITLRKIDVSFLDKESGRTVRARVAELLSSLQMDSSIVKVSSSADMILDITGKSDSTFFRDKNVHIDITADYLRQAQVFEIATCALKLQDASFTLAGRAGVKDTTYLDFRVKGDEQNLDLFTAFIPADVNENLKPFQYSGRLYFDALVKGNVTKEQLPLIEVTFGCEDAWLLNKDANKKVDKLGFKGYYTNGSGHSLATSELQVMNVSARPERGIFKGNFVVRDFTSPRTLVQINSELELKFLGEFLGIPDLRQITGTIKLDMNFKELHDIKFPEESLNRLKEGIESKLTVENLSFRIPGYPHPVRDMNIHAEMRDGRVSVDSASLKIGRSDLRLSGSISDVRAFLRDHGKTINVKLNASSDQMIMPDLLSYDTALARAFREEIHGFNVNMILETTVTQLLNPSPLPKGKFDVRNLRGSFAKYGHKFKNLGASILINDTLLRLRDFSGMIDSSDINFKGRITNYHLWFDDIKKGKTQIAFDFKSSRFALKDVFTREVRQYLPRGYRREELNNVWLRAKFDLKYDTIFRFVKGKISNVTAELKRHKLKLTEISGGVKYGSKILSFDTLRGKIGNSDFDIGLKYYFRGVDRYNNKIDNELTFNSKFLDLDEMSRYDLAPKTGRSRRDTTAQAIAAAKIDSSRHAQAFNIFMIPFSNFNTQINITKVKYNRLWLKDVAAKITMREDQTIAIDTLMLKVAGGAVRMRGKFNGSNHEKIYFRSRINFDQVDIEKMMLKLDHFGQDVVVNKHIKGKLNGQIRSYVQVHPNLVPIVSNSKAELNMTIVNGSLVDFAPMQAMAGYFKDKNLRLIRFDTLHNKLSFANGVLSIPTMHINSSLGYIQLSGKHALDLSMEYYVRVPMKMVTRVGFQSLFNKKQEEVSLDQVDEVEFVDKEKKIAFMNLKITGTPDKYKVGLGKNRDRL